MSMTSHPLSTRFPKKPVASTTRLIELVRTTLYFLLATVLLVLLTLSGCASLRPEPLPPSNQMRTTTSDSIPTGMDNRARQIESNLGVR